MFKVVDELVFHKDLCSFVVLFMIQMRTVRCFSCLDIINHVIKRVIKITSLLFIFHDHVI